MPGIAFARLSAALAILGFGQILACSEIDMRGASPGDVALPECGEPPRVAVHARGETWYTPESLVRSLVLTWESCPVRTS